VPFVFVPSRCAKAVSVTMISDAVRMYFCARVFATRPLESTSIPSRHDIDPSETTSPILQMHQL
jgi:hypothetical protein